MQQHYERLFSEGQTIFEEGDDGTVLYVIQTGQVQISRSSVDGRRDVACLGPGDFFGEMSVVVGEPRTARAVAATECRLLELDGETFEAMCVDRPEIAIRVIRRLTDRLIESERRLAALGVDDFLRPMVRALVRRAGSAKGDPIPLAHSLRELAKESGMGLNEAHRALHQLLDRKLVRLVDDVLVTSDLDGLSASIDVPG